MSNVISVRDTLEQALETFEKNLYTSTPTIPEDIAKDAERYRWIRENGDEIIGPDRGLGPEWVYGCELDAEIDAAILSTSPKGE